MALRLDPEIEAAMAPMMAAMASMPKPAVGDVEVRRQMFAGFLEAMFGRLPVPTDVTSKDYHTTTADGHSLLLRWITKTSSSSGGGAGAPTSAIVYAHGGGMIMANITVYNPLLMNLVSQSGVPLLAVEFRPAPEHRGPTMAEDAFAGLTWLHAHATELHVDTSRIGIMGDSGGGCVAAGTALLARDRGLTPALAKQILIYPMLDDRNVTPDTSLLPFMVWSYEDNLTAWAAVLGKPLEALTAGTVGDDQVSPYTAPARLTDAANLPPTFIEVGNLDIFRDEDIEYARKLALANVTTELHVRAGCPHGWEGIAPEAKVTQVSRLDRIKALQSF